MIADVSTIVARGMGVRRRGRWVLRPAAFGIAEGVIGIAGPLGAGKTTLLATFATLRRPRVGALEVLGFDTGKAAGLRSARARIGYLPDHFSWAGHLSVREFIEYSAYYKGVPAGAVRPALRRLELDEVAGVALSRLPADLRLRAGLAATCVHRPDLVLLDEPLAGLDERAVTELSPLLRTLARTVLITATPDLDGPAGAGTAAVHPASATGPLADSCDRVYLLARGRLTEAPPYPGGARGRHRARSITGPAGMPAATGPSRAAADQGWADWPIISTGHVPAHAAPAQAAPSHAAPSHAAPSHAVPAHAAGGSHAPAGRRLVAVPAGHTPARSPGAPRPLRGVRTARPVARPPAGRGARV